MKRTILLSITISVCISSFVSAELIRDGIDIEFVTIGNPGNAGDTRAEANPSGCGAVSYTYQIGKYEVTNAQWDAFVSAAEAPAGNPSHAYDQSTYWTGNNIPANRVSWYEAAQFCNYLTSGDKSQGVYMFSGNNVNPGDFLGIDRDSSETTYGIIYFLPTEDEWYKAAYYTGSDYSTYANGTAIAPSAGDDTNYGNPNGQPWDVGTGTMEQNGTFDMMGNLWEWNETLFNSAGGVRGGCYGNVGNSHFSSSIRLTSNSTNVESITIGFRVATIPEPCTLLLFGLGCLLTKKR